MPTQTNKHMYDLISCRQSNENFIQKYADNKQLHKEVAHRTTRKESGNDDCIWFLRDLQLFFCSVNVFSPFEASKQQQQQ